MLSENILFIELKIHFQGKKYKKEIHKLLDFFFTNVTFLNPLVQRNLVYCNDVLNMENYTYNN